MGKKWGSREDVHMERATVGIKTVRSRPRRRTEKGAPCLRTTCGKSLRCETEKRMRSIVSSHVHMCVAVTYTHTQTRREYARMCLNRLRTAFFRSDRDISSCSSDSTWKLMCSNCRKRE